MILDFSGIAAKYLSMMFYLKLYIESKTNTQAIIKQKTTVLDQQHYSTRKIKLRVDNL
jgi:ATP-dependent Lon protease